jgi:molecular chaperone DnaK (HSP70)
MSVLVRVGTALPARARKLFATADDNQGFLAVEVYQGEHELVANNRRLGRLVMTGIARAPRGKVRIALTLELTRDGILHVSASESGANASLPVAIEQPEDAELSRAFGLLQREKWADAIEIVAALAIRDPANLEYQLLLTYLRGRVAEAAGSIGEALEHYRAALRIDPDCTPARAALAKLVAPRH